MEELIKGIPDLVKYIFGLIVTGVIGWFGHMKMRKKTASETVGIELENNAKIRTLREAEIKHILNTIDALEAEIVEYKKNQLIDKGLLELKEKELQAAKTELYEVKRQLTKVLIINSQLNAKHP